MAADLTREVALPDQLGLAPELRLVSYTYRERFGRPPVGVWHAPGLVTLLADGPVKLTVAAPWGASVAAESRADGVVEPVHMNRPGERATLTVAAAAAGSGPQWAGAGLRAARTGATLLVTTDLPDGSGIGSAAATETAIGLALGELAVGGAAVGGAAVSGPAVSGPAVCGPASFPAGTVLLGGRRLPCDLAAAGLRLMVIDTRMRAEPLPSPVERSSLEQAATVLESGEFAALGPLLTSAHAAQAADTVQEVAVAAALRAGALGARMTTDGPGRPVCALVSTEHLPSVRAEVSGEFSRRGLRTPRYLTFTPAAGPRRAASAR